MDNFTESLLKVSILLEYFHYFEIKFVSNWYVNTFSRENYENFTRSSLAFCSVSFVDRFHSRIGILCWCSKYGTTSSKWRTARRFLLVRIRPVQTASKRSWIQAAIANDAELSKPERPSISQKRKVIENKAKYKSSRMQMSISKTSFFMTESRNIPVSISCMSSQYVIGQLRWKACYETLAGQFQTMAYTTRKKSNTLKCKKLQLNEVVPECKKEV